MNNSILLAILLAGVISYLLRVIPLLIWRKLDLGNGRIIKVLDYASCCIMGEIIYSAGFGNASFQHLTHIKHDLINLVFILLSFYICCTSKSIMKSIVITLSIYAIVMFLTN